MKFKEFLGFSATVFFVAFGVDAAESCFHTRPSEAGLRFILADSTAIPAKRREAIAAVVFESMKVAQVDDAARAGVNAALGKLVRDAFADLDLKTTRIGEEIALRTMPACALVTSSYKDIAASEQDGLASTAGIGAKNAPSAEAKVRKNKDTNEVTALEDRLKIAMEAIGPASAEPQKAKAHSTDNSDKSTEVLAARLKTAEEAIDSASAESTATASSSTESEETDAEKKIKEIMEGSGARESRYFQLLCIHDQLLVTQDSEKKPCGEKKLADLIREECPYPGDNLTARCSSVIFEKLRRAYFEVVDAAKSANAIDANSDQSKLLTKFSDFLSGFHSNVAGAQSRREASYGVYIGPSMALKDNGEWKSGSEFLLRAQTEIFDADNWLCFTESCRGYTEISYTSPERAIPETTAVTDVPFDPFEGGEGVLRVRAGLQAHFNDWMGLEGAIGLTSPLADSDPFTRVEPHFRFGAHFQTPYTDGAIGELSVGVEHDRSSQRVFDATPTITTDNVLGIKDAFNRFYFDGTLLFPNLSLGGWRLATRLSADAPLNGNEQADVRASVLFYYPFSQWLDTKKPPPPSTP